MHLLKVFAAGLVVLLLADTVRADPITQLKLSSGATTLTIDDNGAGDLNPLIGVITYSGAIESFIVNVATGSTKPLLGSETDPILDLASVNISGAAGSIEISFSSTDFLDSGYEGFRTLLGGTTEGVVTVESYAGASNSTFDTGTPLSSFTVLGGAFARDEAVHTGTFGSPYSLTVVATVSHFGPGKITSLDAMIAPNPEPSTMVLMGAALAGAFALRRRRRKTA